jgi:DNA-binding PadR family transcriptional regulator
MGDRPMTDAELAILSVLAEGPRFDHELYAAIENRGLGRWTAIGASSVYYPLEKLERQGLVSQISGEHGPRQFTISPAGVGVLQTAVTDLLSTPYAYDKSFELGIANLNVLKSSQVRTALLDRQQDLVLQINHLRGVREHDPDSYRFQIDALFSHHIAMMEAELSWLKEFYEAWEAQAPADPEVIIEPVEIPRMKQVILPHDPDSVHKQNTQEVPPYAKSTPPPMGRTPPMGRRNSPDKPELDDSE